MNTAPNELIAELDAGMMVAVPLHETPEFKRFDMANVYRAIARNPAGLEKVGEDL